MVTVHVLLNSEIITIERKRQILCVCKNCMVLRVIKFYKNISGKSILFDSECVAKKQFLASILSRRQL